MTGVAIIAKLESSLSSLIKQLGEEGNDMINNLGIQSRSIVAELRAAMGEEIGKPIMEMSQSVRYAADRGLAIASVTSAALRAAQTCAASDAQKVAANLSAHLGSTVRDAAFWSGETSFVAATYAIGAGEKFGVYAGRAETSMRMVGAFNGLSLECGEHKIDAWIELADGRAVELAHVSADPRSIVVTVPPLAEVGTHRVVVRFPTRKGSRGCAKEPTTVQTFITVVDPPEYHVSYQLRASCPVVRTERLTGRIDLTNDTCDGDKHARVDLCAPSGWSYVDAGWVGESVNGCEINFSRLGDRCATVQARCPERGGWPGCWGARKWAHGVLFMDVSRPERTPAETPVKGEFANRVFAGESVRQTVIDPRGLPVRGGAPGAECEWDVAVSVTSARGGRLDLPTKSGRGPLQASSPAGVLMDWNPKSGEIFVSAPPYSCEFLF